MASRIITDDGKRLGVVEDGFSENFIQTEHGVIRFECPECGEMIPAHWDLRPKDLPCRVGCPFSKPDGLDNDGDVIT